MTALASNPCSALINSSESKNCRYSIWRVLPHMLSIRFAKMKVAVYPHKSSGGDLDCSLDEEPDQTGLIS